MSTKRIGVLHGVTHVDAYELLHFMTSGCNTQEECVQEAWSAFLNVWCTLPVFDEDYFDFFEEPDKNCDVSMFKHHFAWNVGLRNHPEKLKAIFRDVFGRFQGDATFSPEQSSLDLFFEQMKHLSLTLEEFTCVLDQYYAFYRHQFEIVEIEIKS